MHHTLDTQPYITILRSPCFTLLNVCPFTEALHAKLLELLKGFALAERRVRCRSRLREKRVVFCSSSREDFRRHLGTSDVDVAALEPVLGPLGASPQQG